MPIGINTLRELGHANRQVKEGVVKRTGCTSHNRSIKSRASTKKKKEVVELTGKTKQQENGDVLQIMKTDFEQDDRRQREWQSGIKMAKV